MQSKTLIFLLAGIFSIQAQTSTTTQNQNVGTSCTTIPGVGSPILMLANAKQYIEDSLNIKNQYTVVKYLYFALVPPTTTSTTSNTIIYPQQNTGSTTSTQNQTQVPNVATIYRVVFSITDYYGSKYAAVELAISPFGIGGVKINKFLLTSQLSLIKRMVDPNISDAASINCGDLKFVYNAGDSNQNLDSTKTTGLSILNSNISPYATNNNNSNNNGNTNNNSNNNTTANNKNCVTANFLETNGLFGTTSSNAATGTDLINCVPNKNSVSAIMIGCTNNAVASIQLMFNNYSDAGSSLSAFTGNPNTPASAITTISLGSADRIAFTSTATPASIKIQTFDANNVVLATYNCGNGTASPQNVIVSARDFLGITNVSNNGTISAFEVTQYKASN